MPIEDSWIWSVYTHDSNRSSLVEIQTQWSCDDLLQALDMCEYFNELERLSRANAGK